MYIGLEEEYFAFMGHFPQQFWGVDGAEVVRLVKRYKTPCSKSPLQFEEASAACKSVRAGTHYLPDLPIYLGVLISLIIKSNQIKCDVENNITAAAALFKI